MFGSLRTGLFAGTLAAFVVGGVETCAALSDLEASGASAPAIAAMPLFFWALLLPVGAVAGLVWAMWCYLLTLDGPAALSQRWRVSLAKLLSGSLSVPGHLVGGALVAGVVVAVGTTLSLSFEERFNNATLRGALLVILLIVVAIGTAGVVDGALRLVGRGIRRIRLQHDIVPVLTSGPLLLAGLALVTLIGAAVAISHLEKTIHEIGADTLLWLVSSPLILVGSWAWIVWKDPGFLRRKVIVLAVAFVGLVGTPLAVWMAESRGLRQAAFSTRGPSSEIVRVYRQATDFDRDGASAIFGGGDCAPDDPAIGPLAAEIPLNGIDEDCSGGDSEVLPGPNPDVYAVLPEGLPENPNVVLISVDALRADHLGVYGYERATSPGLDRHAERAVVFERGYSQMPGTIGAMPSLFTSKYPLRIERVDREWPRRISPDESLMAEYFRHAGYSTIGISTIRFTNERRWNLLQGFEELDLSLTSPDPAYRLTSDEVLARAIEAVERQRDATKPYFLWVHFFDVHSDYLPWDGDQPFGEASMDIYDGEILRTDRAISQLLDLVLADDQPPTIVVLTSDHGDGFVSDRGRIVHGYGLHEELLHIPLIIWAPDAPPHRVQSVVGNVDVLPTLLNLVDIRDPSRMGRSLVPHIYEGFEDDERQICSQNWRRSRTRLPANVQWSCVTRGWRYSRMMGEDTEHLYDLENDPIGLTNVLRERPEDAERMRTAMNEFLDWEGIDTSVWALDIAMDDAGILDAQQADEPEHVVHAAQSPGRGGSRDSFDCPTDHELATFEVMITARGIAALRSLCRPRAGTAPADESERSGTWRGARSPVRHQTIRCDRGDAPVGLFGKSGRFVTQLGAICERGGEGNGTAERYRTRVFGAEAGSPFTAQCPPGTYVAGYRGRAGAMIDAAGVACASAQGSSSR